MQSIDTSAVLDYRAPSNVLAASVAFAFLAGSGDNPEGYLTITDNTTYGAGDSRRTIALTVADKFGKKKEYGTHTSTLTADLGTDGFNPVDGIDIIVTVASTLLKYKDGTVFGIGIGKPSGNVVMEL